MKQGVEFNQLDIFFSLLLNNFSLSKEREKSKRLGECVTNPIQEFTHGTISNLENLENLGE